MLMHHNVIGSNVSRIDCVQYALASLEEGVVFIMDLLRGDSFPLRMVLKES
jgi:hypothetical protein